LDIKIVLNKYQD